MSGAQEIREKVLAKYGAIARTGSSCCGPNSCGTLDLGRGPGNDGSIARRWAGRAGRILGVDQRPR